MPSVVDAPQSAAEAAESSPPPAPLRSDSTRSTASDGRGRGSLVLRVIQSASAATLKWQEDGLVVENLHDANNVFRDWVLGPLVAILRDEMAQQEADLAEAAEAVRRAESECRAATHRETRRFTNTLKGTERGLKHMVDRPTRRVVIDVPDPDHGSGNDSVVDSRDGDSGPRQAQKKNVRSMMATLHWASFTARLVSRSSKPPTAPEGAAARDLLNRARERRLKVMSDAEALRTSFPTGFSQSMRDITGSLEHRSLERDSDGPVLAVATPAGVGRGVESAGSRTTNASASLLVEDQAFSDSPDGHMSSVRVHSQGMAVYESAVGTGPAASWRDGSAQGAPTVDAVHLAASPGAAAASEGHPASPGPFGASSGTSARLDATGMALDGPGATTTSQARAATGPSAANGPRAADMKRAAELRCLNPVTGRIYTRRADAYHLQLYTDNARSPWKSAWVRESAVGGPVEDERDLLAMTDYSPHPGPSSFLSSITRRQRPLSALPQTGSGGHSSRRKMIRSVSGRSLGQYSGQVSPGHGSIRLHGQLEEEAAGLSWRRDASASTLRAHNSGLPRPFPAAQSKAARSGPGAPRDLPYSRAQPSGHRPT